MLQLFTENLNSIAIFESKYGVEPAKTHVKINNWITGRSMENSKHFLKHICNYCTISFKTFHWKKM